MSSAPVCAQHPIRTPHFFHFFPTYSVHWWSVPPASHDFLPRRVFPNLYNLIPPDKHLPCPLMTFTTKSKISISVTTIKTLRPEAPSIFHKNAQHRHPVLMPQAPKTSHIYPPFTYLPFLLSQTSGMGNVTSSPLSLRPEGGFSTEPRGRP